jgi:Na+-transporting methylmalonyl-CoA/oxaloacetate decarboxylase gamma subunit
MQRTFAVVLLLALLVGQVRMIGALVGRYQARQQMQEQIESASQSTEEERVQHLTIARAERQSPTSSFVQVEEREFRYEGKLYDVVRAEWRGDVWHVWAVHDRAEEHYLEVLEGATNAPMVDGEAVPTDQRFPVFRPVAPVPTAQAVPGPPFHRARAFPRLGITKHQAPYLEVPHPPPWGGVRLFL